MFIPSNPYPVLFFTKTFSITAVLILLMKMAAGGRKSIGGKNDFRRPFIALSQMPFLKALPHPLNAIFAILRFVTFIIASAAGFEGLQKKLCCWLNNCKAA